ncbi:ORF6N domain-containing protein [Succiniclasticum ruminis]|uniref:ORF6N domain-containing protein n=1 Tax=Succiniclasticum ruminis DSM 9236 TaxID=1123323 RepID=A0A1I2E2F3_9FIRM|nr:ORF6N domain-containing protein [Succiniclasticum ruminis]SFE86748.1 ORF6N domain-containing protein [Succiniclasticum ruminis DSM 9236]
MDNDTEVISLEADDIKRRIFMIRGRQVMLDKDLAELYGYEVKNLNRQVKRNIRRFPKDFMFQLTQNEMDILRCQNVTTSVKSRTLPYAFTEQGIYMLATVLRGELAETQSIFIMRAFREMRHFVANNAALFDRISKVELKQLETDKKFDQLFEYIGEHTETNQKLFFDGQIYDAFSLLIELIQKADQEIILIDGYVDVSTLNVLAKKKSGVAVTIYTFKKTKLTVQDVAVFNAQYPQLEVKYTSVFHDRFLILDGKTVYHIGASLKDAGKKCFAVSLMKDAGPELMKKLAQCK